ncbi:zf-CCHC domain-containing protein [Tanacetum coccineum]
MTQHASLKDMVLLNVTFDEKRGTIFNSNKEIVMIALRVRDVYVLDMTFSIKKYLYLLQMDLFGPVTPRYLSKLSSPYTPEQNCVAERKNRTLIEAARTMLSGYVFSKQYWTEAVATACYTQNRYNTIITSLKALNESFSIRNHVRKFLRPLPTKWRPNVTAIKESKDLSTLLLDELIGNLKVYKISSKEEGSCSRSDEEYAMAVRDFKKFFRRRGKFARQPHDDKKCFRKVKEENKGKEDRRCFKCSDPNHFISDCLKHSFNDQKEFVGGRWSDSDKEDASKKDEICFMALDNNEVCLKAKLEPDEWIKDSRCSRHMTGNKELFSTYKAINRVDFPEKFEGGDLYVEGGDLYAWFIQAIYMRF